MSKVIIFSTVFPSHHPKSGKPTHFVEKLHKSLDMDREPDDVISITAEQINFFNLHVFSNCEPKHHTVRQGHRWKEGDIFSPRIWSGIPYQSKQIILAPDIEIKKIWKVEIFKISGQTYIGVRVNSNTYTMLPLCEVAENDGLSCTDFVDWFNVKDNKNFCGQILCWSDFVKY